MSDHNIEPPFTPKQFATDLEYWKEAEKFQRKRAEAAEAKNAELTRKLAAYQAVDVLMRIECKDDPIVQQTPEPSYTELTKLLAEASDGATGRESNP